MMHYGKSGKRQNWLHYFRHRKCIKEIMQEFVEAVL